MQGTVEKTSTLVTGIGIVDTIQIVLNQICQIIMTIYSSSPQRVSTGDAPQSKHKPEDVEA